MDRSGKKEFKKALEEKEREGKEKRGRMKQRSWLVGRISIRENGNK